MNEGQKGILNILLLESVKPLFVQDIAERVNYSEKTVRNTLKRLRAFYKNTQALILFKSLD
jgi:activator of the mannose operon, transcriptional antiterminator